MTEQQLFEKYKIEERHKVWQNPDSWYSIEIFRFMHDGRLPNKEDVSAQYLLDFMEKTKDMQFMKKLMAEREDWGSLYLTGFRSIWFYREAILEEINKN